MDILFLFNAYYLIYGCMNIFIYAYGPKYIFAAGWSIFLLALIGITFHIPSPSDSPIAINIFRSLMLPAAVVTSDLVICGYALKHLSHLWPANVINIFNFNIYCIVLVGVVAFILFHTLLVIIGKFVKQDRESLNEIEL